MIPPACFRNLRRRSAFTLAEIALTLGIFAGTALLTLALFSSVTRNIQRLKESEATLRPGKTLNPAIRHPQHPLPDSDDPVFPPDQQAS
ncbi:hypothetical protein BH11VER1_BH11VER1_18020 [soil metagenome]